MSKANILLAIMLGPVKTKPAKPVRTGQCINGEINKSTMKVTTSIRLQLDQYRAFSRTLIPSLQGSEYLPWTNRNTRVRASAQLDRF